MTYAFENLVLIAASGGTIIVLAILLAVFCICRHVRGGRRSSQPVIQVLSPASPLQEAADPQQADDLFCERNQLLTAEFSHPHNSGSKAKICAKSSNKKSPAVPSVAPAPNIKNKKGIPPGPGVSSTHRPQMALDRPTTSSSASTSARHQRQLRVREKPPPSSLFVVPPSRPTTSSSNNAPSRHPRQLRQQHQGVRERTTPSLLLVLPPERLTANRRSVTRHEVIVIDGSEPPPPYSFS